MIRLRISNDIYNSHKFAGRSCLNAYILFELKHFPLHTKKKIENN